MTAKSVNFATNLPQLQNLMKRDPPAYREEFLKQWQYYLNLMQTFELQPSKYNENLDEIIMFLAQVSHCYKEDIIDFPEQLGDLLKNYSNVLDRTMRMTLVKALIMLRNKELISATQVLQLFFKLLRCEDKLLRKTVYQYIVSDIKNVNAKHKNAKLNSALQTFMFSMLQESSAVTVKTALDIMVELYRRSIWRDAKTVNVITTACFSKITKVMVAALKFFLGNDEAEDKDKDSSDSEDEGNTKKTAKDLVLGHRVGKKTKKRQRKLTRAMQVVNKHKKKKKFKEVFDTSAHHLIHDPQEFSEKLFRQLEKSKERFEVKLMMIDLISRMIGVHKLLLLNFYPFMKPFLQPHQREVTRLLLYLAQGSHELVPPETLEEVLKTIANNFITERNSGEVMAVGLNAVREVCMRCPLAMSEDLLRDLTLYKGHKDKAVLMGARSLIQLFRQHNRDMLHRRDRGKITQTQREANILQYGQKEAKTFIAGAEIVPERQNQEIVDQKNQDEWESASEDEDNSDDDWVDVHHSSDEEMEEEEAKKKTPEEIAEAQKIAEEVSANVLMTDEDFKAINNQQISKDLPFAKSSGAARKARKRKREEDTEGSKDLPSLGDIEMVHKKRMHDKDSRLSTVMAGREGREKYAHGPQKMNPNASTNNKQKTKKKAFNMVKHKIRQGKVKRSFKDKQIALRNSLLKRKKSKF